MVTTGPVPADYHAVTPWIIARGAAWPAIPSFPRLCVEDGAAVYQRVGDRWPCGDGYDRPLFGTTASDACATRGATSGGSSNASKTWHLKHWSDERRSRPTSRLCSTSRMPWTAS